MNDTFGDAARRLNGIAAQFLGWRPNEFWGATPSELTIALRDPGKGESALGPSRHEITQMMERDSNG